MELVNCRICKHKIDRETTICPNCGARNRGIDFKALAKSILIVFVAFIAFNLFRENFSDTYAELTGATLGKREVSPSSKPVQAFSEYDYKTQGARLSYREALLENIPINKLLIFSGEITQTLNQGNRALIATKESFREGRYLGDSVALIFSKKPQIVEGDVVEIRGRYNGTYTYKTVIGSTNKVPSIKVDFYTVLKARD